MLTGHLPRVIYHQVYWYTKINGGCLQITKSSGVNYDLGSNSKGYESKVLAPQLYTLHPTPYTLHPTPHTPHPTPLTLHTKPTRHVL